MPKESQKSQIKFPLHYANDAQGQMGILDANGKAVVWCSEVFTPTNGYVWEPGPEEPYYQQRTVLLEAIMMMLNAGSKLCQ
jgi:hypothetical protein